MTEPTPPDAWHYLHGKLDAVELLASAVAAVAAPLASAAVLGRCAELREKVARGEALSAYEQGFLSAERTVRDALTTAAHAEKVSAAGPPGTPH